MTTSNRSIEPKSSLNICQNCGAKVDHQFCGHCGQSINSRRGPIWHLLSELSEEWFAPNSKLFSSLWLLFIRPGALTVSFISGKRVAILPPVRLYLVISLIFFFVFQIDAPDIQQKNLYINNTLVGKSVPDEGAGNFHILKSESPRVSEWIDQLLADKKIELQQGNAQLIVSRIFNIFEAMIPNALILFLPLLALMLKLLFIFKRVLYIDHLLFALHFNTWLMCWILIIYGLAHWSLWFASLAIVAPVYLALAQRRVYQQSYLWVIPKTLLIICSYLFMIALAIVTSMTLSLALL